MHLSFLAMDLTRITCAPQIRLEAGKQMLTHSRVCLCVCVFVRVSVFVYCLCVLCVGKKNSNRARLPVGVRPLARAAEECLSSRGVLNQVARVSDL